MPSGSSSGIGHRSSTAAPQSSPQTRKLATTTADFAKAKTRLERELSTYPSAIDDDIIVSLSVPFAPRTIE